ncbi:MAG: hypothetical protein J6T10_09585 [Methanobrevibacter sp.]|nr:hypothetical protein [Methanobrevibacter sp.]
MFKRANLSQEIQLSKTSNIGNTFYTSPVNLTLGESIKFWPKLNTYVNDQTAVES